MALVLLGLATSATAASPSADANVRDRLHLPLLPDPVAQRLSVDASAIGSRTEAPVTLEADRVSLTRQAAEWQANQHGAELADVEVPHHGSPSDALTTLMDRHNTTPSSEDRRALQVLDTLPAEQHDALTRFVDAFLAFDAATQRAYEGYDPGTVRPQAAMAASGTDVDPDRPSHQSASARGATPLAEAGVDLGPILTSRTHVLQAATRLQDAFPQSGAQTACDPLTVAPAFSIDLTSCDNLYEEDVAVLVDGGGDDRYRNNAGGSNLAEGTCQLLQTREYASAALIDLGHGEDAFGDRTDPRSCGANGGGYEGAGFLFDEGGDDVYHAHRVGTNGGGSLGAGFLLDETGNDTYTAASHGTNGGGDNLGTGSLLDRAGNDTYTARLSGANGGATSDGVGFLLDRAGNDAYGAEDLGTNGGGWFAGVGALLDGGGSDTYTAEDRGTNGGGDSGTGFLLDEGGDDTYTAGTSGTNGGAHEGANFDGEGTLIDEAGNDSYAAADVGTNGGGADGASGLLVDRAGNDTYQGGFEGTNGGAAGGEGRLLDRSGDDTYAAEGAGTNGGGYWDGEGFLLDRAGNDIYTAEDRGTNGGGWSGGVGALLDGGGRDEYEDGAGGTGVDRTVAPKGTVGAQVDSDDTTP
ncbi:hypothetical protein BRD56_01160 [Thermoplasmatales archaeon SW_10_69_26]|nr:MAG: hypothetical protein BRD56_01160 [Thermoplasmatales archaeon SW_10_69_26]